MPGVTNLPWQSISTSPSGGRREGLIGLPGTPTATMAAMRSRSMTMSAGPQGGAPVPSMMVAPRSTSRP
ncbi:hypothetical protein [Teichococcus aestuarii]|uniref:hypothetical protein n=1 Tax=Teichococcus aestuarii TaxID=568898 RepID=UPI0036101E85